MSGRPLLHPRAARWALVLAVVLVGLWPYLAELERIPMTADGRLWLERGDPASEGWREWVFRTRHFQVGYRPVAALTYTATLAARGVDLVALRLTDLALHAGVALALAALVGRLVGRSAGGRAVALGGLAALLFLAHPACEEVVPYLARRSYSLALLAALVAALCVVGGGPRGRGRAALASACAGFCVFAALLTNELAVLPLAALPLLALAPGGERGTLARLALLLGPLAGACAAALLRQMVVGGLGGYEADADGSAAPSVALSRGLGALLGFEPRGAAALGALAVLVVHVFAGRLGNRRERLASLALATWLVVGLALFAGLGVWFGRLGHALAPAWAALVALHVARVSRLPAGTRRRLLFAGLAISTALPLFHSPLLRGADADRALKWSRRQAVVDALVAAVDGLEAGAEAGAEEGARLQLVLPFSRLTEAETRAETEAEDEDSAREEAESAGSPGGPRRERKRLPRDARVVFRWLQFVRPASDVRYAEFVYVEEPDWSWAEPTRLGEADGEPAVIAPEGRALWTSGPPRRPSSGELHVQRLLVRGAERRLAWYVFLYRPDGGAVLPIAFD